MFFRVEGGFMKKRLVLAILSLALIVTVIFVYSPSRIIQPAFETPPPKKDLTVVALGDSLTKGVGDLKDGGYIGYVQHHLEKREDIGKVTVYNYGVKGDTSDDLLERLKSKEVQSKIKRADLILFTIGGNDLMEVVENHFLGLTKEMFENQKQHYKGNLEKAFRILREQNLKAQIVYISLYNPFSAYFPQVSAANEIIDDWSQTGKQVTAQFNYTAFVQTYDLFEGKTKELISDKDNFHPNEKGYTLIGQRVMNVVKTMEPSGHK